MNTIAERLTARGSPFEIVETSVGGVPCRVFRHAPRTLIDIYRRARSCGDRGFLISGARSATYREIFGMSGRISRVIRRTLEHPEGARIAVIFYNVPEWIASFIAVTSMGATAVAVHRASALGEMAAAIDVAECAMVICDEELAGALSRKLYGRRAVGIGPMGDSIGEPTDDSGSSGLELPGNELVQPESVAMIAFTSGSTNRPKGVELTHRSMTCGMMNAMLGGALASAKTRDATRASSRLQPAPLLAAPFSHVSGYGTALLSMYVGGKIVTMERWDPKRVVELMKSEKTTALIGITSQMLREWLHEGGLAAVGDFVRSVVVQGTSLPQGLLRELKMVLPEVSVGAGYGLTETNGSVCIGSEAILAERPATAGKALPTVDLKIQRADGKEAIPEEVGEVMVRGAMLMRGYVNLADAPGKALQDGWLRTGDLGWLDRDGFLYLADRADHFVICGGVKVPCSVVEQVVLDNELATEAVALHTEGDEPTEGFVLVVSCPQEFCPDDSVIIDALRKAGYEPNTPRIVRLNASMPKTPSGKIDRRELRRRFLAGEAAS